MDETRQGILLYGGTDGKVVFDDLWVFVLDDALWSRIYSNQTIPARSFFSFVFTSASMVVINGNLKPGPAADKTCCLQPITSVYKYDIQWGFFEEIQAGGWYPGYRYGHSIQSVSDKHLWLFGGLIDGPPLMFNDLWKYAPMEGQWEYIVIKSAFFGQPPVVPPPRGYHVWVNGGNFKKSDEARFRYRYSHIYGGADAGNSEYGDFWQFNHLTRSWQQIVTAKTPGIRTAAAGTMHSHGKCTSFLLYGGLRSSKPLRDMWKYDFLRQEWSKVKAAQTGSPPPRITPSSLITSNGFYLFGGIGTTGVISDLWRYDANENRWHELEWAYPNAKVNPNAYGASLIQFDANTMLVHGGHDGRQMRGVNVPLMMQYNRVRRKWTRLDTPTSMSIPEMRIGSASTHSAGMHYMHGGKGVQMYDDIWVMHNH